MGFWVGVQGDGEGSDLDVIVKKYPFRRMSDPISLQVCLMTNQLLGNQPHADEHRMSTIPPATQNLEIRA